MENVFNLWQSQDKKDLSQEAYSQKDANRPELDSTERYILGKVIKSLLPHWGLGRWYKETSKLSIQINHAEVSFFTTFHSKSLSCLKCLGLECRRGEFSEDVVPSKPQCKSGPVILVSLHYWLKAWKPVRTNPGTRAQTHVSACSTKQIQILVSDTKPCTHSAMSQTAYPEHLTYGDFTTPCSLRAFLVVIGITAFCLRLSEQKLWLLWKCLSVMWLMQTDRGHVH